MPIPPGYTRCPTCGEFNGVTKAKYLNFNTPPPPEQDISVSCLCKGIPCFRCKTNKIRRPTSNTYYEDDNSVWHTPWFSGMLGCGECREREEQAKSRNKRKPKSSRRLKD